jgi:hypothetical protein
MTRFCHGQPVWVEKSQRKTSLGLMELGPPKFAAFVSVSVCVHLLATPTLSRARGNGVYRSPGRSQAGWAGGWEMFRVLNEASCCARGRAHSGMALSAPPPPATSEFGFNIDAAAGKSGGGPPPVLSILRSRATAEDGRSSTAEGGHSKTLARFTTPHRTVRSVLDCASPLALCGGSETLRDSCMNSTAPISI